MADCLRWLVEYEDWHRGELLLPGGMEQQPAKWVQRCRIMDGEYSKKRKADADKRAKEATAREQRRNYG